MKYLLILPIAILFAACNSGEKKTYIASSNAETKPITIPQEHPGKKLIESKCYSCHSPTASHDDRLAPPMIAVKSHYLGATTTEAVFSDKIWEFVQDPSEEKSKMRGAVRRFGVMPIQEFKEEEIRLIAAYLYESDIEAPEWFKDHKGKHRNQGKH